MSYKQIILLPLSNYLLNGTSSDHTLLWGVVFFISECGFNIKNLKNHYFVVPTVVLMNVK
ncbi:protein of unknown function [Lactiplantibacillus plantarum]